MCLKHLFVSSRTSNLPPTSATVQTRRSLPWPWNQAKGQLWCAKDISVPFVSLICACSWGNASISTAVILASVNLSGQTLGLSLMCLRLRHWSSRSCASQIGPILTLLYIPGHFPCSGHNPSGPIHAVTLRSEPRFLWSKPRTWKSAWCTVALCSLEPAAIPQLKEQRHNTKMDLNLDENIDR